MEQQSLAKGTVLGGRFEIDSLAGQGDLGFVYKAQDTSNKKLIALRVIPKGAIPNEADVDRMRMRVKEASTLTHRNVRATFGMGVEKDGTMFIATEWVEGQNLRSLLQKRTEAGKRFSFKGAYNIVGHVCNALTYAHKKTHHGSLSPRAIMVNNAGRVKVSDWGLSIVRTRLENYAGRDKVESIFWAPEVMKGAASVSPRSDIYALGALFYELICGVAPRRPLKAPSKLGFSKDVDTVVARCMSADPMQRFDNAAAVKNAISILVEKEAELQSQAVKAAVDDDLGIDVEVDLTDMGAPEPGTNFKEPVPTFSAAKGAGMPAAGPGGMMSAPGLPAPPSEALGTAGDDAGRASTIDMGAVLSGIGKSESAKWMVQKDKLDHGPFTDRELIQMIMRGEVINKHVLTDMDTGVRKKVKAWGDFDEYLERYRIKKKQEEEAAALVRTEKAEKRGTAFKLVIAAAILGGIGLIVGGIIWGSQFITRDEIDYGKDDLIAAFDSGEIQLKGASGDLLSDKKRRGKRRKGGKGGKGGGGTGDFVPGMSYEDAMNAGVDLGSLQNNAGQRQLTAADIQNIMDKNVRRFLPCMDGSSKKVTMDIAVAGSGQVIGVSVKEGSSKLKKCVASKVRRVKFPSSGAPRTATSWWFEIY